jgi:RNase P subunit RPR2
VDERDDEVERMLPGWRALAETVAEELTAWRRAHPRATLTEIEAVVFEVGQRLQARALQQVVQASAAADVAVQPAAERPTCPSCNGRLEPRGRHRRTIRPARQRAMLEVDRSYAVCAECGAGLFPPG